MIRDTPHGSQVKGPLIATLDRMSDNAGVRRNRRPRGAVTIERKVHLDPLAYHFIDDARSAGDPEHPLSTSLYLERLIGQLVAERGTLPVFDPTLDGAEVETTTAA